MNWSAPSALKVLQVAQHGIGDQQREVIVRVVATVGQLQKSDLAERLNQSVQILFGVSGAKPTALELIGILNYWPRGSDSDSPSEESSST